jgi:hypothetical protein
MAWLQPQLTRERPDTFKQTVVVGSSPKLATAGQTIHSTLSEQTLQAPSSKRQSSGEILSFGFSRLPKVPSWQWRRVLAPNG